MSETTHIKKMVQERYAEAIQHTKAENASSCCGSACGCNTSDLSIMAEDYSHLDGYVPEADYALGCGIPTEAAQLRGGDVVLDLGSGAGNDVFVARRIVGDAGRVIGLDMTEAMIAKANDNNAKLGYRNVEFRLGDIERMPVDSGAIDVIVSNCVLNLVPDKKRAFAEMFRVLKPGGHFAVSDIVIIGVLPERLKSVAELYAGCISGAIPRHQYLSLLEQAGFANIALRKQKHIALPESIQHEFLTEPERSDLADGKFGLLSITVVGTKPPEAARMLIRSAETSDLPPVQALLRANDLPADDVAGHFDNYLVALVAGRIVGVIGMERYGNKVFLRSMAVEEWLRGFGIGRQLHDALMKKCEAAGVRRVALLTTTAESFFAARGFQTVTSDAVPEFVRQTKEYTVYCPSSSICMVREL